MRLPAVWGFLVCAGQSAVAPAPLARGPLRFGSVADMLGRKRIYSLLTAECAAGIVSVLGLVTTLALLPETKGRSLEEISVEPEMAAESTQRAA